MSKYVSVFKQLLEAHGGPGFEEDVRNLILPHLSEYATEMWTDALGNLIGLVPGVGEGRRPRVLVSAHIDEIALVVTRIESGGFLRLAQAGGFDPRTLVGQEVVVHAQSGRVWGVIGAKPPHLTPPSERSKAAKLEDLYVDLALPEEEVRARVRVGDRVTLRRSPVDLLNGRIAGKSVDNRASAAVLLEALALLKGMVHSADLYAVFTVQEEVGLRGPERLDLAWRPTSPLPWTSPSGRFPGRRRMSRFRSKAVSPSPSAPTSTGGCFGASWTAPTGIASRIRSSCRRGRWARTPTHFKLPAPASRRRSSVRRFGTCTRRSKPSLTTTFGSARDSSPITWRRSTPRRWRS